MLWKKGKLDKRLLWRVARPFMSGSFPSPRHELTVVASALCAILGRAQTACAQSVGDCVRVSATHPAGVPLHEVAGTTSFHGNRLPDQAVVEVLGVDETSGWLRVADGSRAGWITRRYLGAVVPCDTDEDATGATEYLVGCWNLEHFHEGASRGFPEMPGQIPPRVDADYADIAGLIRQMDAKILVLEEIFGEERVENGEAVIRSDEMDRLVTHLGGQYKYVIGASGGSQRIAFLYDTTAAHLNWHCEAVFPNDVRVDGKRPFERQPLLGYFTLFQDGNEMNDLVVVGVHLASGQANTRNHDLAMNQILTWIGEERSANFCIPAGEFDVVIAGDFNANRFDSKHENFWTIAESSGWDVLADDSSYSPTRLSGDPPGFHDSRIDYMIVSADAGGLAGEEVSTPTATVWASMVADGPDFRRRASDHLPVTVPVRLRHDDD